MRRYLAPHFYKSASGGYLPIDPVLAPTTGQAGWWHSEAGSFGVSFGPAGAAGGAEQLNVSGAQSPRVRAAGGGPTVYCRPAVTGATASYTGLWADTSVSEQVTASQVSEDIEVDGPAAPSSFSFRLTGATARADAVGGLVVTAGGRQAGVIPAPRVTVQQPRQLTANATEASGARLSVSGGVVSVSVSKSWLGSLPALAFPVVIDPTVDISSGQPQLVERWKP